MTTRDVQALLDREAMYDVMHQALRDAVAALGGIRSDNVPESVRAAAQVERATAIPDWEQRYRIALVTIATLPIPEQDNMLAANMREIARAALKGE